MVIFDPRLTATYLSTSQYLILSPYPSFDPCRLRFVFVVTFDACITTTCIYSTVLNSAAIPLGRAACATLHISVYPSYFLVVLIYSSSLNPCLFADCGSSYRSYLCCSHCYPLTHVLL
ncbi:hypothetical protein BDR03DRAFT_268888 [Suillus americanus]|nr:hypothetical protein BDR03DRAFT_268888 [Suillus americanus]